MIKIKYAGTSTDVAPSNLKNTLTESFTGCHIALHYRSQTGMNMAVMATINDRGEARGTYNNELIDLDAIENQASKG